MLSSPLIAILSLASCNSQKSLWLDDLGDIKDAYDTGKDIFDNGRFAYDVYKYCKASGLSNCPAMAALCTGYQYFISPIISKNLIASVLSELAVNQYCLGDPPLKCCKKVGTNSCWSAFNTEAPLNCEGNPHYGPTETAGLCLAPCDGCAGCLCNYLSDCNPDLGTRRRLQSAYTQNRWKLGRMASIYSKLSLSMGRGFGLKENPQYCSCRDTNPGSMHCVDTYDNVLFCETPGPNSLVFHTITWETKVQQIIDFIEWRGCKGWLHNKQILIDNIPYDYPLKRFNGNLITRIGDIFDEIIPTRFALPYYALVRFAVDIPQFWVKVDWVFSNTWTNDTRIELLSNYSISSPHTEMLRYIDYGGLLLLQDIFDDDWMIFAIPEIDDEVLVSLNYNATTTSTSVPDNDDFYPCQLDNGRGTAAIIQDDLVSILVEQRLGAPDFNTSPTRTVNIQFTVDDTDQESEELIVRMYWDDRDEIMSFVLNGGVNGYQYSFDESHTYSCDTLNGKSPQIRIQVMNEAGLYSVYRETISYGELCKGYEITNPNHVTSITYPDWFHGVLPDIDTVVITMELTRNGNPFGGTGTQIFYVQGATTEMFVNETNVEDLNSDFTTLGVWTFTNGDKNVTAPVNVTMDEFKWSLGSNIEYLRFTCRTYSNYLYSSIKAKIVKLRLNLFDGISIDLQRGKDFIDSQNGPIICSRRGDVYEDAQQLSVLRLNSLNVTDDAINVNDITSDDIVTDGFYREILPGQYVYDEKPTLEPTNIPSGEPTEMPTLEPTNVPSAEPIDAPTVEPTEMPIILADDVSSYRHMTFLLCAMILVLIVLN